MPLVRPLAGGACGGTPSAPAPVPAGAAPPANGGPTRGGACAEGDGAATVATGAAIGTRGGRKGFDQLCPRRRPPPPPRGPPMPLRRGLAGPQLRLLPSELRRAPGAVTRGARAMQPPPDPATRPAVPPSDAGPAEPPFASEDIRVTAATSKSSSSSPAPTPPLAPVTAGAAQKPPSTSTSAPT
jgi:hypothetical protein